MHTLYGHKYWATWILHLQNAGDFYGPCTSALGDSALWLYMVETRWFLNVSSFTIILLTVDCGVLRRKLQNWLVAAMISCYSTILKCMVRCLISYTCGNGTENSWTDILNVFTHQTCKIHVNQAQLFPIFLIRINRSDHCFLSTCTLAAQNTHCYWI